MAPTNGYCTVAEVKARLWPTGLTDTTDDTVFDQVITAVSRAIDNLCNRRFFTTASDETRYYTAEFDDELAPGDLVSLTTLATDEDGDRTYETTWSATDYDLEPFNAALDGKPYTRLRVTPNGNYVFPSTRKGVKLVGKFGYGATAPPAVKEACLLQCERVYKRRDAPFGVVGSAELGQLMVIPRLDPDVELLLRAFRKMDLGGV